MTQEQEKAFYLIQKFGEDASDVIDEVILSLQNVKSCKEVVDINLEYWLRVKDFVLKCSSTDYDKELMLVVSYITSSGLLQGSFFNTYDKAVEVGNKFLEKYPPSKDDWGIEEEWNETVENFVKSYVLI